MQHLPFYFKTGLYERISRKLSELEESIMYEDDLWRILYPSVRPFYTNKLLQCFLQNSLSSFKKLKLENQEFLKNVISDYPMSDPLGDLKAGQFEVSLRALLQDKGFVSQFQNELLTFLSGYFETFASLLQLEDTSMKRAPFLAASTIRAYSKMSDIDGQLDETIRLIHSKLSQLEKVLSSHLQVSS